MVNYFFFVSKRIGGRMKLFALPGQLTYTSEAHQRGMVEVDTTIEVQSSSRDTNIRCFYPEGTVYIAKCEGNTPCRARLPLYTRPGERKYRVDGIVPLISDMRYYREGDPRPDAMMATKWHDYLQRELTPDDIADRYIEDASRLCENFRSGTAQDQPAPAVAQPAPAPAVRDTRRPALIGNVLLESDRNFRQMRVNVTRPEKLLAISHLWDAMKTGVCRFEFIKQNGDHRIAWGTLVRSVITRLGGEREVNEYVHEVETNSSGACADGVHFHYFDVEKRALRCFCTDDFVSFNHMAADDYLNASETTAINTLARI